MNGFELLKQSDIDVAAHLLCYWNTQCSTCCARRLCNVTRSGENGFKYLLERKLPDEVVQTFVSQAAAHERIEE